MTTSSPRIDTHITLLDARANANAKAKTRPCLWPEHSRWSETLKILCDYMSLGLALECLVRLGNIRTKG